MRPFLLGVFCVLVVACGGGHANVQCEQDSNCDLSGGGRCIAANSGHMWCAYPDPQCPEGYRYSNQSIGDGLSGECVSGLPDAGVDAPHDAHVDARPDGGTAPEMTVIPGGNFLRGCNQTHEDCTNLNNELPLQTLMISTFSIDTTEVTQIAYKQCMDAGMCTAPDSASGFDPVNKASYPVGGIQWQQAVDYCTWKGKRLPTEAEWEKASRGTDGREYPWGNVAADCTLAQYLDCTMGSSTIPVGSKAGDAPTGLHDMAGNALEWTNDWYSNSYYQSSPTTDPQGPTSGTYRVIRGGGAAYGSLYLRSSYRYFAMPTSALASFGFRCAKT